MKNLILILALALTGCGSSDDANPFQEALGKQLVAQPNAPTPTDPFAPVLKKN